jgi:hypothetical protein
LEQTALVIASSIEPRILRQSCAFDLDMDVSKRQTGKEPIPFNDFCSWHESQKPVQKLEVVTHKLEEK